MDKSIKLASLSKSVIDKSGTNLTIQEQIREWIVLGIMENRELIGCLTKTPFYFGNYCRRYISEI